MKLICTLLTAILLLITQIGYSQNYDWEWLNVPTGNCVYTDKAIDSQGNVYITGQFTGTSATFGNITLTSSNNGVFFYNMFIVKYDPSGNVLWCIGGDPQNYSQIKSIAIDSSDNIYITGSFKVSINLGGTTISINNPFQGSSEFLCKLDPQGNYLWSIRPEIDEQGLSYFTHVEVSDSGNVYLAGAFSRLILGDIIYTSVYDDNPGAMQDPTLDTFIAKISSSGQVLWAKRTSGLNEDLITAITVDSDENIIVAGTFKSASITIENIVLNNADYAINGSADIFISKYNTQGQLQWVKQLSSDTEFDIVKVVTTDANGDIYLCGQLDTANARYDGTSLSLTPSFENDEGNGFLSKISAGGSLIWAQTIGSEVGDSVNHMVVQPGGIFIAGLNFYPNNNIYIGGTEIVTTSFFNYFIAKFSHSGIMEWVTQENFDDYVVFKGIWVDAEENLYFAGNFVNTLTLGNLPPANNGNLMVAKYAYQTATTATFIKNKLILFPNPANNRLTISSPDYNNLDYSVIDPTGRIISTGSIINQNIDISGLSAGAYILRTNKTHTKFIRE